ncbi:GvpL/GvpF family gas vesicle protein [Halalkalibacter kiskunsagensis]|uniref:GvpL/GvpF family gas vesicle protein n=1 Tax=Halalkalibacter kiskunsagensis TaxID=1548599 RepID=A0ABV6KEL8_9BACI
MGDLIYLYGLIPTNEANNHSLPTYKGFDGTARIYTIPIETSTAIVCKLDSENYSEEQIKDRVNNDMEWLQEKAFHHHETVMKLARIFTIVPLKFCTLYKNQDSLAKAVHAKESKIESAFSLLAGNEEWNVKIYCDDQLVKKQIKKSNPVIEAKKAEISQLPKGRQFFEKKKLDKLIQSELEKETNRVTEKIHLHLKGFVLQGNVKRNWSKNVTEKKENMIWNGVYLISETVVESFLEQIQHFEKQMQETGWKFEVSGPWPAYHFSSFS